MTQRPCDLNMSWSWALVIIRLLEDFPWPQKSVGVQLLDISFFISKLEKKSLLPPPPIPPDASCMRTFFWKQTEYPSPGRQRDRVLFVVVGFLIIKMMYYLVDMKNLSFSILCNSALSFCKGKWRRINEHQF